MPRQPVRCLPDPDVVAGFERIREQLQIPAEFPPHVLHEAEQAVAAGPKVPAGAAAEILDARDIAFVTIDPPGSTDLDQAFAARRSRAGYIVSYAIADVAAFIVPGGSIDGEARARGLTLYSPDRRTSLHPEVISEDAGSLLAGCERQALLWTIELDAAGALREARVERALVRNRCQLSYREAQKLAASAGSDEPVGLLREIGELRLALEAERGAVSLALASQAVVRGNDGSYDIEYDETLPVEQWNAQISLLTGIAASRIMIDGGVGILRTLPEPDPRTIGRLRRTAAALGIAWPAEVSYADLVRDLRADTPQRAAMLSQSARGLRGAGYVSFHDHDVPQQPEHSAIASTYAHVTAPLRRLCDRFANEVLLALSAGRTPPAWAVEALDELPSLMGRARTRDRNLERAIVDYVEAVALERSVGRTFSAVVTDVDHERDRGRIQLFDPAVVAHLPATGLTLGESLQVRLTHADPAAGLVHFETT